MLGVAPGASRSEMREHMRWLMHWLHPDSNPDEWESVFAERVLQAWREAGSLSRSDTINEGGDVPREGDSPRPPPRSRRARWRWVAMPLQPAGKPRSRRLKIAATVLIGVLGLAAASVLAVGPLSKWLGLSQVAAEASAQN